MSRRCRFDAAAGCGELAFVASRLILRVSRISTAAMQLACDLDRYVSTQKSKGAHRCRYTSRDGSRSRA